MRMKESFLPGIELHLPKIPQLVLEISISDDNYSRNDYQWDGASLPFSTSDIMYLPIINARVLADNDDVKTVIELTLQSTSLHKIDTLRAGDTIGILPQNSINVVNELSKRLDIQEIFNKRLNISSKKGSLPKHLPECSSLKEIFLKYVDLQHILKKTLICHLSEYTKDEIEKRCLQEISSREGSSLYSSEILDKCTNILDILNNYKSCNPPIELLLQNLPKLMPRPYSICNSPLGSPDVLKICFSVIKKENGSTGLTTGWLNDLVKESKDLSAKFEKLSLDSVKIPMYIRKPNTFRLPENKKTAIIMIGCGTGVAPFIGFLEERSHIKINEKKTLGPALLYFGCRYFDKDYIYKEELENFVKDEVLSKLRLSFSREIGTVKYVQENVLKDDEEIVELLEAGSIIYICGDLNKIRQEIINTLIVCFQKVKRVSEEDAKIMFEKLQKNMQFIQDIWS